MSDRIPLHGLHGHSGCSPAHTCSSGSYSRSPSPHMMCLSRSIWMDRHRSRSRSRSRIRSRSRSRSRWKHLYEYWPCPLCGVWVETCHLWISEKKGGFISISAQNKIDPASLAVTDQLKCKQGKRGLALDHMPLHDMIFKPIFSSSINLCYMWHTEIYYSSSGFLHLRLSELCLYQLITLFF